MGFLCCKVFCLAHAAASKGWMPPKYFVPLSSNTGWVSRESQKAGAAYV